MRSLFDLVKPASLPTAELWRGRLGTVRAIALLCFARLLVASVPLKYWRNSLGVPAAGRRQDTSERAGRLAREVEWAARRLPFESKCLPQAMALSWLLRGERIVHAVVIAVRPPNNRGSRDALHAWVEVGGATILGDLPGPWIETLRAGG